LEFDSKDLLYVRIDRRRKMPITILLKAMGKFNGIYSQLFLQHRKSYNEGEKIYFTADDTLAGQKSS